MSPDEQRRSVLVVDDSAEVRECFQIFLEDAGFDVSSVEDANAAFEFVVEHRPSVIVTDIMLGGPSGFDLITRLRSDLAPPVPPVIACSGFRDFRAEALSRGATAFLSKPIEADDLTSAIDTALGAHAADGTGAEQHSQALRHRVVKSAEEALAALRPQEAVLVERANHAVNWIADYLGFGQALYLLVDSGELKIKVASGRTSIAAVGPQWLNLGRDIVETQSTLVLPDAQAFAATASREGDVRLFVGIPVFGPDHIAIGALCWVDAQPHAVDAEDLAILQDIGRSSSAVLRGLAADAFFLSSGVLNRPAFETLTQLELTRVARGAYGLELAVLEGMPALDPARIWSTLKQYTRPGRRALCQLESGRLAVLLVRDPDSASREMEQALDALAIGSAGVGIVSIRSEGLPLPSAQQVLQLAETIASRRSARQFGRLDRLSLRYDHLPSR